MFDEMRMIVRLDSEVGQRQVQKTCLMKCVRDITVRAWLIDGRGIATKVKSATQSVESQIKDCGANRECPNCHYCIDNSDVFQEWPGLPCGVKFDPSDVDLLEHLAAKCGVGNTKPHLFIDDFISTLEGDQGIYCKHPENLPGAKKDGSSVHFFHRTINAYATGQRKRRKIHNDHSLTAEDVRWHKTGKTKPVLENGLQKGCKKIMVLYKSSKKGMKPEKSNWVMHQYHLGNEEDEKDGAYVVSKIFYQQQKQSDKNDNGPVIEDSEIMALRTDPTTPKTNTPNPPRPGRAVLHDDIADDTADIISPLLCGQEVNPIQEACNGSSNVQYEKEMECPAWLAGESQAPDNFDPDGIDESLLCKEIFDSYSTSNYLGPGHVSYNEFPSNTNNVSGASCGISELKNLELDIPDFDLADLQFGSQDSILGWLDRL